jgi:DNA repair protein RadC
MSKPPAPKAHFHGHRDRLRERFATAGADALADYEMLELLLFRAIPRRDVKALAKTLIERFGDFSAVLGAAPERLTEISGISDKVAREIKIVQAIGLRMQRQSLHQQPVITSWSALNDYCRSLLAHESREQFRVLFLDKKNRLIADEQQNQGTVDHTPVYPREVMRRALELGASAVILVHNHPSGDPTPSKADIDMTNQIIAAGKPLSVRVHDHIIVGKTATTSFKSLQLM